jgi:alpha-mannosidase
LTALSNGGVETMDTKTTVHIISHSHWDREWYMPFEKHRFYLVKLIDTLLDLFQKDPRFQSFHLDGQTIILEDYLEIRPERKQELIRAIREKKLHIGPWYVLQDAFLTSSEANVRNLLYGMLDAKEYGGMSKIGYFPDTFGIYGQAPQLLNQAGITTAAFGRGVKPTGFNNTVGESKSFESPFSELKWVSPDGSSVLGILFANWYSNGNEIPEHENEAKAFWEIKLKDAKKYASTPHLLFMNGCDHQPVQTNISEAIETAKRLYPDVDFRHSNFNDYIHELKQTLPDKLPTILGELRNQRTDGWSTLVNTASSRIYLKQMNQECQSLLEKAAEPLSVMAYLLGFEYPRAFLRYAWKTLMKNHAHDSICGCSVDEVHREMVMRFEKVKQTADMIVNEKAIEIASKIDTELRTDSTRNIPIIVFNTTGWTRDEVVVKEIELEKIYFSDMHFEQIPAFLESKPLPKVCLADAEGNIRHCLIKDLGVRFGYELPDDGFRRPYFARVIEIEFLAQNLPQFGYRTFYVKQTQSESYTVETNIMKSEREMENEFVHIQIHENGSYTLINKETGYVYRNLGIYENTGDIGNEYMFKKSHGDKPLTTEKLQANIHIVENSPIRAVVEITHEWEIPKSADEKLDEEKRHLIWHKDRKAGRSKETTVIEIKTRLTLDRKSKGPSVQAIIQNRAKDHRIRVLFPTNLKTNIHFADSIFEIVKRNNVPEQEWENPSFDHHQQAFVSVSDERNGLTVANKGLNEYEILSENNTIALTILRSVSELGDWGYFPTPEAQCLGECKAEWKVIPHSGNIIESQAYKDAYQFQVPLIVVQTDERKGELPKDYNFIMWEGNNLAFTSLKLAEERDEVIARWFNVSSKEATLTAYVPNASSSYRSNIIEEKLAENHHSLIQTNVKPYEIVTLGWEFGKEK